MFLFLIFNNFVLGFFMFSERALITGNDIIRDDDKFLNNESSLNKFGCSLNMNEADEFSFLMSDETSTLAAKHLEEAYANLDYIAFGEDKQKKAWHGKKERRKVFIGPGSFPCPGCGKVYRWRRTLLNHRNFECGKEPQFKCPFCHLKSKRKSNIFAHIKTVHKSSMVFKN